MPQDNASWNIHRRIADACAKRMAQQNWRERRRTVETTIQSVRQYMDPYAAGTIVASILGQLDTPTVVDNDQALIFAMSDRSDHQAAACEWFIARSLEMLAAQAQRLHANEVHGATIH